MGKILLEWLGANKDHKNPYGNNEIYFEKDNGHLDTPKVPENWGKWKEA